MKSSSPQELIVKAKRAIESAKLLHNAGDTDGACNRAYYAMFDAAKAALLKSNSNLDLALCKTHNGLITLFGLHLVKTGLVPAEFGRMFNWAYDIRQVADYTGDLIDATQVSALIVEASKFVDWIDSEMMSENG